jgi:hypothetical protein
MTTLCERKHEGGRTFDNRQENMERGEGYDNMSGIVFTQCNRSGGGHLRMVVSDR